MESLPVDTDDQRITINVHGQIYEISKTSICSRCPFFYNAFCGSFRESSTQSITLDEDVAIFEDFVAWLDQRLQLHKTLTWIHLAKLWIFADKHWALELQNDVLECMYGKFVEKKHGVSISSDTLEYVVENTHSESNLRRLLVDMLVNGTTLQQLKRDVDSWPVEILQEFCIQLRSESGTMGFLSNPLPFYLESAPSSRDTAPGAETKKPTQTKKAPSTKAAYCEGSTCRTRDPHEPLQGLHFKCYRCRSDYCSNCRAGHSRSKRMMHIHGTPYKDINGATIMDAHVLLPSFWCDGPECVGVGRSQSAMHTGDRYHCLTCVNVDYCTMCFRGPLRCSEDEHTLVRLRPIRKDAPPWMVQVPLAERIEREKRRMCWKCGMGYHSAQDCLESEVILPPPVDAED